MTKLLSTLLKEVRMDFSKTGGGGGRRYIPNKFEVPISKVKELNKVTNGPHIRVFRKGEKTLLGISTHLHIAMQEMQRGRTSRSGEEAKRPLLKRFQELFSDTPMFRGALKKSTENQRSQSTPFGDLFISDLEVEIDGGVISVKNPYQRPEDLEENNTNRVIATDRGGKEFELKAIDVAHTDPGRRLYGIYLYDEVEMSNQWRNKINQEKFDELLMRNNLRDIHELEATGVKIEYSDFDVS